MVRTKAKQMREMDGKARAQKLQELRTELRSLMTGSSTGYTENPGRLRETRRTIARLMTVERELKGNVVKKR